MNDKVCESLDVSECDWYRSALFRDALGDSVSTVLDTVVDDVLSTDSDADAGSLDIVTVSVVVTDADDSRDNEARVALTEAVSEIVDVHVSLKLRDSSWEVDRVSVRRDFEELTCSVIVSVCSTDDDAAVSVEVDVTV